MSHNRAAIFAATLVAAVVASHHASADITGFSGFAPVNTLNVPAGGISPDGLTFQLTNAGSQAASAFFLTPQVFGPVWEADFTYATQDGADGFTFVIHNDPRGLTAIGDGGSARGYSGGAASTAITNSAAYAVNIYNADNHAVGTGGVIGATSTITPLSTLTTAQPISFKLNYSGGKLVATVRNPNNAATANPNFNITTFTLDVPTAVGGNSGYIGFTGGAGGVASTQTIGNFSFRSAVGSLFTPVSVSGFNADPVVDIGTQTPASTNASIDNGTLKTGWTFYEFGYVAGRGLPMGTTFASANDTAHTFALAPANVNNALLLNKLTPQKLTLASPAAFEALSFLSTTGNGTGVYTATINFTDGAPSEVITGALAPDWFNAGGFALSGLGRIDQGSLLGEGSPSLNPRLYQQDFVLANRTSPIGSIEFLQTAGNSAGANSFIFGVSGVAAVPEPTSACALAVGGLFIFARRTRRSAVR